MSDVKHTPGPEPIKWPPGMFLYMSDWKPRGVRADWEKCSMDKVSTARLVGNWYRGDGEMIEAVAWFNDVGGMRLLVVDYDDGRRLVIRCNRGGWKITYERHDRPLLKASS